jgi:hypothetical protein
MIETTVIEQKKIKTISDVTRLRIIDFNRCNGFWENNPYDAMRAISPWLIGNTYTVIHHDMRMEPVRDDFPGWNHAGNHERMGRLFWNYFHRRFKGNLNFCDMPDFSGNITFDECKVNFQGDVGRVSASAFAMEVLPQLHEYDLWITMMGEDTHLIMECQYDIGTEVSKHAVSGVLR